MTESILTTEDAQALQDNAACGGALVAWVVVMDDSGEFMARLYSSRAGTRALPGVLMAGSLEELRSLLPTGLEHSEGGPQGVLELWCVQTTWG